MYTQSCSNVDLHVTVQTVVYCVCVFYVSCIHMNWHVQYILLLCCYVCKFYISQFIFFMNIQGRKETLVLLVSRVQLLVGWCTLGGEGPHVQLLLEHNSSTQEELLEAGTPTVEVELTISVSLIIQTT